MNRENEKEEKQSDTLRKATIALIGALLTVCGGLFGALLSAGVTIYQVEREMGQIALAAPGGDQALTIDTRQITIDAKAAQELSGSHIVSEDEGFVLANPRAGWGEIEELTYQDLFLEEGSLSPLVLFYPQVGETWNEQPLWRVRYSDPITVQFLESSVENGIPIDVEALRGVAGTDTFPYHSQIIVLALDKEAAADQTLSHIAITWGGVHAGGVNRIIASEESEHILMQATWLLEHVAVGGREMDLSLQRWALFAEGSDNYYIVELNYTPPANQFLQVWEDLQAYIDSFRVIR